MNSTELKKAINNFYRQVSDYRALLVSSRDPYIPEIEKNHEIISEQRAFLNRTYGKLQLYIQKLGKNPKLNDGVWNIWYSPYDNAFTNDVLIRVGSSVDAVLNDLDYILGKLEGMDNKEFEVLFGKADKNILQEANMPDIDAENIKKQVESALLQRIDNAITLAEQKLLKGDELNLLIADLKSYKPPQDTNEILKRKIEKIQGEPNTVWSDTRGYAVSGAELLFPWRELFSELATTSNIPQQKYFRPGSREEVFAYLKTLIPSAQTIKIYDNFLGEEILKLLEHTSSGAEIYILGREPDKQFIKKLPAFATYFNKKIQARKTNKAHARFYIVDDYVYNVDISLRGSSADNATLISPVIKSEAEKIIKDYNEWWQVAEELFKP